MADARFEMSTRMSAPRQLYQMMTDWLQLNGVRITHSWSGFVAMTVDALPHMGKDGLHYCTGCNAAGCNDDYLGHGPADSTGQPVRERVRVSNC